jgi:hypothetical protein
LRLGELLGGRASGIGTKAGAHQARYRDALAQQSAAVQQAIACDFFYVLLIAGLAGTIRSPLHRAPPVWRTTPYMLGQLRQMAAQLATLARRTPIAQQFQRDKMTDPPPFGNESALRGILNGLAVLGTLLATAAALLVLVALAALFAAALLAALLATLLTTLTLLLAGLLSRLLLILLAGALRTLVTILFVCHLALPCGGGFSQQ